MPKTPKTLPKFAIFVSKQRSYSMTKFQIEATVEKFGFEVDENGNLTIQVKGYGI